MQETQWIPLWLVWNSTFKSRYVCVREKESLYFVCIGVCVCVWQKKGRTREMGWVMWSDSKREEDFRVNFECTSYIFSSGLRESWDWLSTSLPAMTDSPDLLYSPYMCVCVCVSALQRCAHFRWWICWCTCANCSYIKLFPKECT